MKKKDNKIGKQEQSKTKKKEVRTFSSVFLELRSEKPQVKRRTSHAMN